VGPELSPYRLVLAAQVSRHQIADRFGSNGGEALGLPPQVRLERGLHDLAVRVT
jgi:hypothetical protein